MHAVELSSAFNQDGQVDVEALTRTLHISRREFARALGLPAEALSGAELLESDRTQQRLHQTLAILTQVQAWAGGISAAWSWYRSQPIPAFGRLTCEELVAQNRADEVRAYLSQIAAGGYA